MYSNMSVRYTVTHKLDVLEYTIRNTYITYSFEGLITLGILYPVDVKYYLA